MIIFLRQDFELTLKPTSNERTIAIRAGRVHIESLSIYIIFPSPAFFSPLGINYRFFSKEGDSEEVRVTG